MVAVRAAADVGERLAAVGRAERARVQHVDGVFRDRIGDDVRVVEGALPDVAVLVDEHPGAAGVVRDVESALVVLDQRVDPVRVGAGHVDADAPDDAGGQAGVARDLGPGVAAVGGLEEAAAGSAARHLVLDAVRLPHRGVQHVRVAAVDHEVDRAGLVVAEEHLLPRLAAVGALEDAALVARSGRTCRRRRRTRCRDSSDGRGSSRWRPRCRCRSRCASRSCRRRSTCTCRRRA